MKINRRPGCPGWRAPRTPARVRPECVTRSVSLPEGYRLCLVLGEPRPPPTRFVLPLAPGCRVSVSAGLRPPTSLPRNYTERDFSADANTERAGLRPGAAGRAVRLDPQGWAFVASPLRAIADLVYTRRQIDWRADGIGFLTDSMRIDPEDLPIDDLDEILAAFRNPRVRVHLIGLRAELGR